MIKQNNRIDREIKDALNSNKKTFGLWTSLKLIFSLVFAAVIFFYLGPGNNSTQQGEPIGTKRPGLVKENGRFVFKGDSKPTFELISSKWKKEQNRPVLVRTLQVENDGWFTLPLPKSVGGELRLNWLGIGTIYYSVTFRSKPTGSPELKRLKIIKKLANEQFWIRLVGEPMQVFITFAPGGFRAKKEKSPLALRKPQIDTKPSVPAFQVISSEWQKSSKNKTMLVIQIRLNGDGWHPLTLPKNVEGLLSFEYQEIGQLYVKGLGALFTFEEAVVVSNTYRRSSHNSPRIRKIGRENFTVICKFFPQQIR